MYWNTSRVFTRAMVHFCGKAVHHHFSEWLHYKMKVFWHCLNILITMPFMPKDQVLHHWRTWWSCHDSVNGKLKPNMTAFSWHVSRQTPEVLREHAVGWPMTLSSLPSGQKSHSDAWYFCKTLKTIRQLPVQMTGNPVEIIVCSVLRFVKKMDFGAFFFLNEEKKLRMDVDSLKDVQNKECRHKNIVTTIRGIVHGFSVIRLLFCWGYWIMDSISCFPQSWLIATIQWGHVIHLHVYAVTSSVCCSRSVFLSGNLSLCQRERSSFVQCAVTRNSLLYPK